MGTQCEIKIAAKSVREIQKNNIEVRIENERLLMVVEKLNIRITNLSKEKNDVLLALKKIQS